MDGNTNLLYLNRSMSNGLSGQSPDDYLKKPPYDFVLCRDSQGNTTAVYGQDSWDFNPYRLSAKRLNLINFTDNFGCKDREFVALINEQIKYILYVIIYQPRSGRTGRVSASTLGQYFYTLRKIGYFCIEQLDATLASGITINDVLSKTAYMNAYLTREAVTSSDKKVSSAIIEVLSQAGFKKLGFIPCSKKELNIERDEDKQNPVIPSRIYIEMMLFFDNYIDLMFPFRENLKSLIKEMEDRNYGASIVTQKERKPALTYLRPTMEEAIVKHNLIGLFQHTDFNHFTRANFSTWIKEIQYVCKMYIHFYTGMRDQEAGRLLYDCTSKYTINEAVFDSDNNIVDSARMVDLVSTTTKFTGYKKEESWIAPDCVLKAIDLAKSITEGLAFLYKVNLKETVLFLNPSILRTIKSRPVYTSYPNVGENGFFTKLARVVGERFNITEDDLLELSQTDPTRDFSEECTFSIGCLWPITSHQFRRSLAFYASNSGFVSLDTVTTQFKHTSRLMAKYYGRGCENLLPIFHQRAGEKHSKGKSHIIYEFQLSTPVNIIEQLFSDVFDNHAQVLGGTGSYMEKMKIRIDEGEIAILDSKEKTIKMAKDGHISYRETVLGGCTGVEVCKCYLMGEITECLTSACSIIEPSKVNSLIAKLRAQIERYEPESCEFELAEMELQKLEGYKRRKMKTNGSTYVLEIK